MTREEALELLGMGDYNEAYRALSKRCHPDGPSPDPELWTRINEAKQLLSTPTKCPDCKGAGRIALGGLKLFCQRCRGLGSL